MTHARTRAQRALHAGRACVLVALASLLITLTGCRPVVAWFGRDPARVTLVEVLERRGRQRVVVDGVEGPWFDAVGVASLVFTEDGHVAYPALRGGAWHVVHDGRLGPAHDGVGDVALSPDGTRLMYAAARGNGWTVMVDGQARGTWTALAGGSLRLVTGAPGAGGAPGPLRWSFIGYRGEDAFVEVDGHVAGPFDTASPPVLEGPRSAFVAVRHERARVFIDGAAGVPFAQVRDLQLVDGRVAYLGHSAAGSVVVFEGVAGSEHPALRHLRVHPSGRWFAIRSDGTAEDAAEAIVLGTWPAPGESTPSAEQRLPVVGAVQQAAFLSDARVVWIGATATHAQVHVEGEAQALHTSISALVVHGAHYAYVGEREGQHHVTVDGVPAAREDQPIDSLVVSATGEVAYHTWRALDARTPPADVVVALGGQWPAPGFVEGSLVCLSDAPHCAHLSLVDEELRIVIDGTHHVPFDLEEAVASATRRVTRPALGEDSWLRAWLLGELRWFVATASG